MLILRSASLRFGGGVREPCLFRTSVAGAFERCTGPLGLQSFVWHFETGKTRVHSIESRLLTPKVTLFKPSNLRSCRAVELCPGGLLWFMVPSGWEDKDERSMIGTWLRLVEDAWRDLVEEGVREACFFQDFNIHVRVQSLQLGWK